MEGDDHDHEGQDHGFGDEVGGGAALPDAVPFRVKDKAARGARGDGAACRSGGRGDGRDGGGRWLRGVCEVGEVWR